MSTSAAEIDHGLRQTLDRRRVFIFPTRHGFMLGSMMFVILLGSINYDNALGYLLTFLLFGLFLVGMLHTYRNLSGLSYLGAEANNVFAEEAAVFVLSLDNRGAHERFSLSLQHWPAVKGFFKRRRARPPVSRIPLCAANGLLRCEVRVPSLTRGTLTLERTVLTSTFPLGILRAWAYFRDDTRCVVYPKPMGELPLPVRGDSLEAQTGGAVTGTDDFAGFRNYIPGDPIRAIAWKALARNDTVVVKRFTSGGANTIRLRWLDSASLADVEARLSQLCAWILAAEQRGLRYGLELPQQTLEPDQGAAHRERCLTALALY